MLNDCPECWDNLCLCGVKYKRLSNQELSALILVLQKILLTRDGEED